MPAGWRWAVSGVVASCISRAEMQLTLLVESLEAVGLHVSACADACEEQVDTEATADQVHGAEQKVEEARKQRRGDGISDHFSEDGEQ